MLIGGSFHSHVHHQRPHTPPSLPQRPKPITPASTRKKAAGQKLPAALQRIAGALRRPAAWDAAPEPCRHMCRGAFS